MSILGTKWDQTWSIIERAVARGQARKRQQQIPRLGIDEKAFLKGQNYLTLLYDLDRSTVEAISDGNDTNAGIACLSQLSDEQIRSVEAIAMDMSAAYVNAAKQIIPFAEAKIVHDRFHIMQMATKAVDKVRRGEHRALMKDGDDRLSRTKYVWLTSPERNSSKCLTRRTTSNCRQVKNGLVRKFLEISVAKAALPQPPCTSRTGTNA